jgi:hypothetical protein
MSALSSPNKRSNGSGVNRLRPNIPRERERERERENSRRRKIRGQYLRARKAAKKRDETSAMDERIRGTDNRHPLSSRRSQKVRILSPRNRARARLLVPRGKKYAPLLRIYLSEIRKEEKKRRVIIVHAPLKGPARCWGSPNGFQNPRGMSDMFWFSSRRSVNFEMRRVFYKSARFYFFMRCFFVSLSSSSSFSDYKQDVYVSLASLSFSCAK